MTMTQGTRNYDSLGEHFDRESIERVAIIEIKQEHVEKKLDTLIQEVRSLQDKLTKMTGFWAGAFFVVSILGFLFQAMLKRLLGINE